MINLGDYKEKCYTHLNGLRTADGYFRASLGEHYINYTWWRDNFYCNVPYLKDYPELYRQSYRTYLKCWIRYENELGKFSEMIKRPHNDVACHYLHPRVNIDGSEIWNKPWGFKQNDAVGYILIGIYNGEKQGLGIIQDNEDRELIQLVIDYLIAIRFWETADSGTWEENEELRSSSIGICMRALCDMKELGFNVPTGIINKALIRLAHMLPYSTPTRLCDLDLLFLVYLKIADRTKADYILANTHKMLEREYGIIRYIGDKYYNSNPFNVIGSEAQWLFGFAYLSMIYNDRGQKDSSMFYLYKILNSWKDGSIPELVYGNSLNEPIANDNRPLGWSVAMTIDAINRVR